MAGVQLSNNHPLTITHGEMIRSSQCVAKQLIIEQNYAYHVFYYFIDLTVMTACHFLI